MFIDEVQIIVESGTGGKGLFMGGASCGAGGR